jgi:hypothetical protein
MVIAKFAEILPHESKAINKFLTARDLSETKKNRKHLTDIWHRHLKD